MSQLRGASSVVSAVVSADSAFWTASWMPRESVDTASWLLRADRGVTNRANSAVPRGPAGTAVAELKAFYGERSLPAIAQIPTHARFSELDGELAVRGYTLHTPTLVQLLRHPPRPRPWRNAASRGSGGGCGARLQTRRPPGRRGQCPRTPPVPRGRLRVGRPLSLAGRARYRRIGRKSRTSTLTVVEISSLPAAPGESATGESAGAESAAWWADGPIETS